MNNNATSKQTADFLIPLQLQMDYSLLRPVFYLIKHAFNSKRSILLDSPVQYMMESKPYNMMAVNFNIKVLE